ncbi:BRCA1-associated protein [Arachis hypogaea]|nr:BRCA1-associated protein [Arachis hypogaea]
MPPSVLAYTTKTLISQNGWLGCQASARLSGDQPCIVYQESKRYPPNLSSRKSTSSAGRSESNSICSPFQSLNQIFAQVLTFFFLEHSHLSENCGSVTYVSNNGDVKSVPKWQDISARNGKMKELKLGEYLDENAALNGTVDFDEHFPNAVQGVAMSTSWRSSTAVSSPPILISIQIPIPNEEPSSFSTSVFNFSSGNPRIEETRGLMHLFPDQDPPSTLPFGRKPLVFIIGVPNHMTYTDFFQFCGSFLHDILEMCIVRMDGMEDQNSILIHFDNQSSTDSFFKHYNGRRFSSLEVEVCRVPFTLDVQYTGSIEHAQPSNATSAKQPTCPVCLGTTSPLDMHCPLSLLYYPSPSMTPSMFCVVYRAVRSRHQCAAIANSKLKNPYVLFVRLLRTFGYVLYAGLLAVEGHAIMHWKETHHCYALDVKTKCVWDFAGDNYVHRLIQSKIDGKLVELSTHCVHAENGCGSCSCEDNSMSEALLNSKVEAVMLQN